MSQHLICRIFTFKCFKSNNYYFLIYDVENNFLFAPKYSKRVSSMNVTKRLIFQNTRQRFVVVGVFIYCWCMCIQRRNMWCSYKAKERREWESVKECMKRGVNRPLYWHNNVIEWTLTSWCDHLSVFLQLHISFTYHIFKQHIHLR